MALVEAPVFDDYTRLVIKHANWFNNIKCDPLDPLNSEKNNIRLQRPKVANSYVPETYQIVFTFRSDERHQRMAEGEFEIGPASINRGLLLLNHTDYYPTLPVGTNPKYPQSVSGDNPDPKHIKQSFQLTCHGYHPAVLDENGLNKYQVQAVEIARQMRRWVSACLIMNPDLKWSLREVFWNDSPNFDLNKAINDSFTRLKGVPSNSLVYEPSPDEPVLSFSYRPCGKEDAPDPKKPKRPNNPNFKPILRQKFYLDKPWVCKLIEHGHWFNPMKIQHFAKTTTGLISVVDVDNEKLIRQYSQPGMVFMVRVRFDVVVKDYNWNLSPKVVALVRLGPPQIPVVFGKYRPTKTEPDVLQEMETKGFQFPLVEISADGREVKTLEAPEPVAMLSDTAAHPEEDYQHIQEHDIYTEDDLPPVGEDEDGDSDYTARHRKKASPVASSAANP